MAFQVNEAGINKFLEYNDLLNSILYTHVYKNVEVIGSNKPRFCVDLQNKLSNLELELTTALNRYGKLGEKVGQAKNEAFYSDSLELNHNLSESLNEKNKVSHNIANMTTDEARRYLGILGYNDREIESMVKTYAEKNMFEELGEAGSKIGQSGAQIGEDFVGLFTGESNLGDFFDSICDYETEVLATTAIVVSSCTSGVLKIAELAADGIVTVLGTEMSCVDWGIKLLTTLDINSANSAFANSMDNTLDYVREDQIGKLNDWFYKDTGIGTYINAKSVLKYDSNTANTMQNASKYAGEFVICCIPGMQFAAPIILGLEGAGESTENYAKSVERESGQDYNYALAGVKTISGFLSGYAQGKANVALAGTARNFSEIKTLAGSIKDTGLLQTMKLGYNEAKNAGFSLLKYSFFRTLKDSDTWIDAACIVSEEVVTGIETGEWNLPKIGVDFVKSFSSNLLFSYSNNLLGTVVTKKSANASVSSFFDNPDDSDWHWGADQNSTNKYKRVKINDPDWIEKNKKELSLFLANNYEMTINAAENMVESWKTKGGNGITKIAIETIVSEMNPLNLDNNSKLIEDLITIEELPEYTRQKNILIQKGLSEADSIKVLDSMDRNIGNCTYASAANAILSQFDGNEEAFKKSFGFDMYVEIGGKKRLNSNELILDMFEYLNSDKSGGALFSLDSNNNLSVADINAERCRANINSKLKQYFDYKDPNLSVNLTERALEFGKDEVITKDSFLKDFDIDFNNGVSYRLGINANNNALFSNPTYYFYDANGDLIQDMSSGGHSIFLTNVTDDAVECSSWGKKCFIKLDNFKGANFVVLDTVDIEVK